MKTLKCLSLTILISVLSLSAQNAIALTGSANVSSACATLEFMAKLVAINSLLPADYDDIIELREIETQLAELNTMVCQPVILSASTRGNSRYDNGTRVSDDLYYNSWYFSSYSWPSLEKTPQSTTRTVA
jgi:hypothetical protein